jgi:DNA-binding Lrp family transcriptional regulator
VRKHSGFSGRTGFNFNVNRKTEKKEQITKDIELKLVSELVKNSRRSDRELAKAVGASQPTVSRVIKKLEKEGVIKEYTMIPDFTKIGYHLLAITFVKLRKTLNSEEAAKAREITKERLSESHFGIIMLERGLGLGYDGVIISFYEDFAKYSEHKGVLMQYPFLEFSDIQTFLISLDDKVHYRPLTLTHLANILRLEEKRKL